jgi:hypothetical protein
MPYLPLLNASNKIIKALEEYSTGKGVENIGWDGWGTQFASHLLNVVPYNVGWTFQ